MSSIFCKNQPDFYMRLALLRISARLGRLLSLARRAKNRWLLTICFYLGRSSVSPTFHLPCGLFLLFIQRMVGLSRWLCSSFSLYRLTTPTCGGRSSSFAQGSALNRLHSYSAELGCRISAFIYFLEPLQEGVPSRPSEGLGRSHAELSASKAIHFIQFLHIFTSLTLK